MQNNKSWNSPFLERPIWPSLGALWPSLCGLAPPSWPFTWGCPGLYWPAGPGCLGGPLGGMSSGIPEAPYISAPAERVSPGWPLDVDKVRLSWSNGNSGFSLPQQHKTANVWTSVDKSLKINREKVRVACKSRHEALVLFLKTDKRTNERTSKQMTSTRSTAGQLLAAAHTHLSTSALFRPK